MSEMIERVAKAIYEGRNGRGCKPWGNLPGAHKEPYLKDARDAIKAMRAPTEGMLLGRYSEPIWSYRDGYVSREDVIEQWQGMLDAALSVSDGSPQGQDAKQPDPTGRQRDGEAGTPTPLPIREE